ncbi:MAG TPA: hypothetical protein V6C58_08045 [Allocoleopsis sp.]
MYIKSPKQTNQNGADMDLTMLIDPALIRAARKVYQMYFEVDPDRIPRPMGVAVDRVTHKGHVIFSQRPILLPREYFVPFNQIESFDLRY